MTTHLFRLVSIFSAAAALWVVSSPSDSKAQALDPRFGLETNAGKGAGWGTGFSSFDWFQPVTATQTDITFVNWSANVDWDALLSNNLGFGYRMYNDKADRMFGFYGFYDVRDSDTAVYHQVSLGFETVGPNWVMRSNMYIPIKPPERLIAISDFSDPFFQGNFISQSRTSIIQTALPGADIELGMPLPVRFGATLYGGVYGYVPTVGEMAPGWRTRLEARLTDNVLANVAVQDDRLFGLTANLGLAWYWRGWRPTLGFGGRDVCCGTGYQRMATPVWRQKQIAVHDRQAVDTRNLTHIDPITGNVETIRVVHVRNNATGSQNIGTFEDPLTSLGQVSALSRISDIIFVYGNPNDTTGMNQGVTLLSGQRLLAGGFQHFVDTIEFQSTANPLGTILLPGFDPSLRGQTITNTVATSRIVTLDGDQNEVSGFNLFNSRASAIANQPQAGAIVGGFDPSVNRYGISINRNNIVDFTGAVPNTGAGIFLTNPFGDIRIGAQDPRDNGLLIPAGTPVEWGNYIAGHPAGGIIINKLDPFVNSTLVTNDDTNVTIANNTIVRNGDGIPNITTALFPLAASDNGITIIARDAPSGTSTFPDQAGNVDINAIITNNVILNNGVLLNPTADFNNGIHLHASNNATISALITDNNRLNTGSPNTPGFSPFATTPGAAGISNSGRDGIFMFIEAPDGTGGTRQIDLAVSLSNAQILARNPGWSGSRGITNNIIDDNGTMFDGAVRGDGIRGVIDDEAPGNIILTAGGGIANNSISGNLGNGIFMLAQGQGNAAVRPTINILATGNTIDNNGSLVGAGAGLNAVGSGISLFGDEAADVILNAVDNVSISNNAVHGVFGQVLDDFSFLNITVSGTGAIDNNGSIIQGGTVAVGDGVHAQAQDTAQLFVSVTDNDSISGNQNNGVFVTAIDDVIDAVVVISGNTINNNGNNQIGQQLVLGGSNNNGVFVGIANNAVASVQVTGNNTIDGNGFQNAAGTRFGDGVNIQSTGNALYAALDVVSNDSISNNVRNGVNIGLNTGNATAQVVNISNNGAIDFNGGLNDVGAPIGAGVQVVTLNAAVLAGLNIDNNDSISDNGQRGVFVSLNTNNGTGQNVSISDNGAIDNNGLVLDPSTAPVGGVILQTSGSTVLSTLNINRNGSVSDNVEYGINVEINSSLATNQNVFINDNVAVNNNGTINAAGVAFGDGIRVNTTGATVLNTLQINRTTAATTSISGNTRHGINVGLNSTSGGLTNFHQVSIDGHTNIDGNGSRPPAVPGAIGNGVNVSIAAATRGSISISDNQSITDNAVNGIFLQTAGTAIFNGRIANNLIEDNGTITPGIPPVAVGNGIVINALGTSQLFMDGQSPAQPGDLVVNNVINGNVLNGISAFKATGATLHIGVSDNVATANGGNGVLIVSEGGAAGTFRGLIVGNNVANPSPPAAANGLSFNGLNGIRVDVNSNGNASPNVNPDLLIQNNIAQNNGIAGSPGQGHGILVNVGGNNNGVRIEDNTADMNAENGLQVNNTGAGNIFVINNNTTTFSANGLNGIAINNTGATATYNINNNTASNNGTDASRAALFPPLAGLPANTGDGNGLLINNNSTGATFNIGTVAGNTFTDNFRWGIRINNNGGTTATFNVQNNTLTGNGDATDLAGGGLNVNNNAIGATFNLDGNIIQDNVGHGLQFTSNVNTAALSVSNFTNISGNGLDGILVQVTGGTVGLLQINGNQGINNNGGAALAGSGFGNGISLVTSGTGLINTYEINGNGSLANPITGNFGSGIQVVFNTPNNGSVGAGGTISGNFISDNGSALLGGNGITVANNAVGNRVSILSNTISNHVDGATAGGGNGVLYTATAGATNGQLVIGNTAGGGNTITGNGANGIRADIASNGINPVTQINGNTVTGNATTGATTSGIALNLTGSSTNAAQPFQVVGNTVGNNGNAGSVTNNGIAVTIGGSLNVGTISGNQVTNATAGIQDHGIAVTVSGASSVVDIGDAANGGNTATGHAAGNGIAYNAQGPSTGNTVRINNNTSVSGNNNGVSLTVAGTNNNFQVGVTSANTIQDNLTNGLLLNISGTNNDGTINGNTIGNSVATGGAQDTGINYTSAGTGHAVTITANIINDNTVNGIVGVINGNTGNEINVQNNTSINGTTGSLAGVDIRVNGNDNIVRIENNPVITDNQDGVLLTFDGGSSSNRYTVSNNTANSNRRDGIAIVVAGTDNDATAINQNTTSSNVGNGIRFEASGLNNDILAMTGNTANNNTQNGIFYTFAGTSSLTATGNTTGGGAGLQNGANGVRFAITGTGNVLTYTNGNSLGNTGNGALINVSGGTNRLSLIGGSYSDNDGDGINFTQTSAFGVLNTFIVSSNPLAVPVPTTPMTIGNNGGDGLRITLSSGTLETQVYGNTFGPTANSGEAFVATSSASTDLGLQLLHNTAAAGTGFEFDQTVLGTFRFENPDFDEAFDFPLFQANTNGGGPFTFSGVFDGSEDVALGTFFTDPGAPY